MRLNLLVILPFAALAGCSGYAADYWGPETDIIARQLPRYGFDQAQATCAGRRLTAALSVWQLRQLERIAKLVPPTHFGRAALEPRDLAAVAAHVENPRVRPEVEATVAQCAPPPVPIVAAAAPQAVPDAVRTTAPLWLNLGAAPSGQSIAVNASSIAEQGRTREAWFRLTNPGATGPSGNSYLLRVDCDARSINSLAFRSHGSDGSIVDERDHRPAGEGIAPIVGGTVMEIAYLALCT
ncbi:MAG TPA: hypothetical protein VEW25_10265 [Allosphingosinicella sp.]|nr:hypothetical protein [Allosphingosinicella sp.]